jgi:hypothetical protein
MGLHGGVLAYKFEKVKNDWDKIKERLFDLLMSPNLEGYRRFNKSDGSGNNWIYSPEKAQLILDKKELGNVDEFCEWFRCNIHEHLDTPFPLGEYIILPHGDNINDPTSDVVDCFNDSESIKIETW